MSDEEDKKYKKDRPGLFDFSYYGSPREVIEHQVKHKFSKWEKGVNKAFKPYKHYLKDQLNPQNSADFKETESRVSAANEALKQKLGVQAQQIGQLITGELGALGHSADPTVTNDYNNDARLSKGFFAKEANFERENIHDQGLMDAARGLDYNILAKAYRQDLRNTPPDPMMGKPAGSGFAPMMGGGWGGGTGFGNFGGGFGFTPYTQPNRSQGTQDALKSLLSVSKPVDKSWTNPNTQLAMNMSPLWFLSQRGMRTLGAGLTYQGNKSRNKKKSHSSIGHVTKKHRKAGRTDINTGKSWEPRGDGGKTYSGIGATK